LLKWSGVPHYDYSMSERNARTDAALWWQTAVFYQIYPRSFQDSNSDGIGDLGGIISRLDYLNDGKENTESLGVDALWISPFYKSPMKDFGYDISDYKDVDRMFGSLEDFKELLAECRKRNLRVVIDLVINHTSDEHPWFRESRLSKESEKRDWYIWHPGRPRRFPLLDKITGRPARPNNWISTFELKSAWWWDRATREYYLGTFTRSQPEVNWRNDELREEMFDVIKFWLSLGVDGYRMDVVNWFLKDERFRSNPWSAKMDPDLFQEHIYDRNRDQTHEVCRRIRSVADTFAQKVLIGEVFTDHTEIAASYHGNGNDELHMAFNFDFLYQPWDASKFYESIMRWYNAIPAGAWPNFNLSNHDQPRHYSRYAKQGWSDARARVAAAMMLTLRGTPFLYYGEEIGMENMRLRKKELQDPFGKKTWPIESFGRDPERTPMQWDGSSNAGFTDPAVKTWLPVNPNSSTKNVAAQTEDPGSLLSFYRLLIRTRKEHPELAAGEITFVIPGTGGVLGYIRSSDRAACMVLLNFTEERVDNFLAHIDSPRYEQWHNTPWQVLAGTHRNAGESLGLPVLHPAEVLLLHTKRQPRGVSAGGNS